MLSLDLSEEHWLYSNVFCAICGTAFWRHPCEEWAGKVVLLTEHDSSDGLPPIAGWTLKHESKRGAQVLEWPAVITEGSRCQLVHGEASVNAYSDWDLSQNFPVHEACLELAKQIIRVRSKNNDSTVKSRTRQVTSVSDLFEVLMARRSTWDWGVTEKLDAPHNYYLPREYYVHNIYYDRECLTKEEKDVLEADPLDIPNLAESLISCLQPLPQRPQENLSAFRMQFQRRIESLPAELFLSVLDYLYPLKIDSSECTRLLSPSIWKGMLLNGQIIPFLSDLDGDDFDQELLNCSRPAELDYERLVRQLTQVAPKLNMELLPGLPAGLRNRIRIWRLVQEMYVGDYGDWYNKCMSGTI